MKVSKLFVWSVIFTLLTIVGSLEAGAQKKGHFYLGGATSFIFSNNDSNSPSSLIYSIEAGLSFNFFHKFSLLGGLGGFRSVVSFPETGPRCESISGPLLYSGAAYCFGEKGKTFRPIASLVAGYRIAIPMEREEPLYDKNAPDDVTDYRYVPLVKSDGIQSNITRQVTSDGFFARASIGTDIHIREVILNVSIIGELTEYYTGAFIKTSSEGFGKGSFLKDGTPVYRSGKLPFGERLRGCVGLSLNVILP